MRKFEQRSQKCYDENAKNNDSSFDEKFTKKTKDILCQTVMIQPNDSVVDAACGSGLV